VIPRSDGVSLEKGCQHQAFRAFVERPASDLALLEALTASVSTAASGAAPAEDLFTPPAARVAADSIQMIPLRALLSLLGLESITVIMFRCVA